MEKKSRKNPQNSEKIPCFKADIAYKNEPDASGSFFSFARF